MYKATSRFKQAKSEVRRRRRSAPGGPITASLAELGLGPTEGPMWIGQGGQRFTLQEVAETVGVSPARLQEWVAAFREEGPSGQAIRQALCGSGRGALSSAADVRPRLARTDGSAGPVARRKPPSKG
jgi:hypothetical protein